MTVLKTCHYIVERFVYLTDGGWHLHFSQQHCVFELYYVIWNTYCGRKYLSFCHTSPRCHPSISFGSPLRIRQWCYAFMNSNDNSHSHCFGRGIICRLMQGDTEHVCTFHLPRSLSVALSVQVYNSLLVLLSLSVCLLSNIESTNSVIANWIFCFRPCPVRYPCFLIES